MALLLTLATNDCYLGMVWFKVLLTLTFFLVLCSLALTECCLRLVTILQIMHF